MFKNIMQQQIKKNMYIPYLQKALQNNSHLFD